MSTSIGRLAVHEYGDSSAPTLLLLHGVTDSGRCWGDLVERLGSSYRLVAPDALGHGESDRLTPEELVGDGVAAMTEAAELVLEELAEAGPVLVLGHSMGGCTAADLAARRPELVAAAVLEDPAWYAPRSPEQQELVVAQRVADAQAVAADPEAGIAACRAEHPGWPESELAPWAQAKADVDLDFLRTGQVVPRTPWPDTAAALTPPTLLVTGEVDVRVDEGIRAQLAEIDNRALEVEVVPTAGHCVRRDQADGFHAVVDPWLRARVTG